MQAYACLLRERGAAAGPGIQYCNAEISGSRAQKSGLTTQTHITGQRAPSAPTFETSLFRGQAEHGWFTPQSPPEAALPSCRLPRPATMLKQS